MITSALFFKVKEKFLRNHLDNYIHANVLSGLEGEPDAQKDYYNLPGQQGMYPEYGLPGYMPSPPFIGLNYPIPIPQPQPNLNIYRFYPPEYQMGKMPPGPNASFGMLYGGYMDGGF